MLKKVLLSCVCLSSAVFANNEWSSPNYALGLSLENDSSLLVPKNANVTQDLTPKLSLLASVDKQLNADWLLTTGVSIDYSQSNIELAAEDQTVSATIENSGIWLDTKLSYQSFHSSVNPFIEMSVGQVYGKYHALGHSHSDWQTGVKVSTGLEFTLSNDSTISLAVGHSNIDNMN